MQTSEGERGSAKSGHVQTQGSKMAKICDVLDVGSLLIILISSAQRFLASAKKFDQKQKLINS